MEKEYDPEQDRDLGQNVMTVSYGLSALYQATDEVLRAYLDSYGYSYVSHFEENNVYRIQYLNQLFFYGITIAGILLLYGLILVVWSLFYLQEQKKRIRLLMELGMERSAIYTDEMQNCSLAMVPGAVMAGILFYAAAWKLTDRGNCCGSCRYRIVANGADLCQNREKQSDRSR